MCRRKKGEQGEKAGKEKEGERKKNKRRKEKDVQNKIKAIEG